MDAYISTLKQQADRGDVAACAALLNHAGLLAVAKAFSEGFTIKFQPYEANFCASDFDETSTKCEDTDATTEVHALPPDDELEAVPEEVPSPVFVVDGSDTAIAVSPDDFPSVEAVAKPIRSRTSTPRTEL